MIKVIVTNINNGSFSGEFEDQNAADAWIAEQIASNSWGKPERWVHEDMLGMETGEAIESEEREDGTYYKFAVEYDISSEETPDMTESNEARAYLKSTDWYIIREMDAGTPCPQEIKDARALARTKVIN